MPALIPIILTATQLVLAADSVPKFDVERTCRPAATIGLAGHDSASAVTSQLVVPGDDELPGGVVDDVAHREVEGVVGARLVQLAQLAVAVADLAAHVIAFDAASGKRLWEVPNGRRFRNEMGDGPRSTPTIEGDRVYAFGGTGELACLDAATGKKLWSIDVVQRFGGNTPYWGYSESPIIVGDRIVLNAGGPRASIVAI